MINKIYDDKQLDKKAAASILDLDTSQVSRMFRSGRIKNYYDESSKTNFTTEADLISYLNSRLPSGFHASMSDDLIHV